MSIAFHLSPRYFAACGLIVLLGACGGDDANEGLPYDQVFTAERVLVVPDRRWEEVADEGTWSFKGLAHFHCWVDETPETAVVFSFASDEPTATYRYQVEWDEEALFATPVELGRDGITVSPALLTPGRHTLTLSRRYRKESERHPRASRENVFTAVGYVLGGRRVQFTPERIAAYHYLGDFLAFGHTGLSQQKRAGFLFVGEQTVETTVAAEAGAAFSVHLESMAEGPSVFRLGVGPQEHRIRLEPGEERPVEVSLPKGRSRLTFAIEGDPEGLSLWGAPTILQGGGAHRTPIILITADTTRRDALTPYGARPEVTPHLADLARRADVFEHAASTAPWTLPSHVSMFTGLYPSRHRVGVATDFIEEKQRPIARRLREAGYLTAGFAGGDLSSYRFGVGRGFHFYRDPDRFETRGDRLTDYVESFLERYRDEPLFLFINYFDAHGPYWAPEPYGEKVGLPELIRRLDGQPVWQELAQSKMRAWFAVNRGEAPATAEGLDYLRSAYLAEVAFMDAQIGRLFDVLRRHELYERALIVLVGDHGELLGERGHFGHAGWLDPELIEVPLIIKWPHQKEGQRVNTLVSGVDIFPTLLRAADLEPPPSDGLSLDRDTLAGSRREQVFMEEHEARVHPLGAYRKIAAHVYGLQKRDFRQVVWDEGAVCQRRVEGVWREVACESDPSTMLDHLQRILGVHAESADDVGVVSEEVAKSLRALGYL